MSEQNSTLWLTKLAAWSHDPAEKALVLLRDPAGHEGGTVRELRQQIFPAGVPGTIQQAVRRADHWASAADRPQFGGGGREHWAQVRFDQRPVLIHPLSGEQFDLGKLGEVDPAQIKALSQAHFESLLVRDAAGALDARRTALNFWRFGPQLDSTQLGALWQLLPADTRVPDHTIWAHLDLSSAFAAAFVSDAAQDAALLAVSFGPVQGFIAAAKSTSDLWAGSHLLSRIAWEGLKVIASEIGPDAVVFPQLRGVPQVDLWLQQEIGLPEARFSGADWMRIKTDANPLFMAALPNKFVAIVPADRAAELAEKVATAVRDWVQGEARAILAELLGSLDDPALPCHAQLQAQLADFPEVHWASVPFGLVETDAQGKALPQQAALAAASQPYLGPNPEANSAPGFLGSKGWKLLSKELATDGATLFSPNPGVLYPAIYELLDRVAAAAKTLRPFAPQSHEGYRCELTGEAEWLCTDRAHLLLSSGQRQQIDTLWTRAAKNHPGLLKKGEHLSALAMLKRFWPRRFATELRTQLGLDVQRYVVSTHTLALAGALEAFIDADRGRPDLLPDADTPSALPARLMHKLRGKSEHTRRLARNLPVWLDDAPDQERAARRLLGADLLDSKPDAYYAFILMDGDRMGAWLAGSDEQYLQPYRATFHPAIQASASTRLPHEYLDARRPVSPARHMAISAALNDFSLHLARHVVEDLCSGKLIYAGGDDVLAMVSVADLLRCLWLLRLAYSGQWPRQGNALIDLLGLHGEQSMAQLRHGHALHQGQLLRLMGHRATASAGAVVAHHQTPLTRVLRDLRSTEQKAKNQGGRDAFALKLLKRSGGATELTLPWLQPGSTWQQALQGDLIADSPMALLLGLRQCFASDTSRRAAYITQGWLEGLPTTGQIGPEAMQAMLSANLSRQLKRQGDEASASLGPRLAALACSLHQGKQAIEVVRDTLAVAEFLAREGRAGRAGVRP